MSTPEPINPYDSPAGQVGMSSGAKVLLGLGIGCGVLALICCGGLIIIGIFFGRSFSQATSTDPATVKAVADSIVQIDVPPPLAPQMSLDLTLPLVNRKFMTMAIFADKAEDEAPDSTLFLFQMDGEFATRDLLRAQFDQQLHQSGRQDFKEVFIETPETITEDIHGTTAEFEFGKGKHEDDDHEVWQAIGSFDGKGGPAMLFMQLDTDEYTEEQARAIIHSMSNSVPAREISPEGEPAAEEGHAAPEIAPAAKPAAEGEGDAEPENTPATEPEAAAAP
jgi:hypothetical protein